MAARKNLDRATFDEVAGTIRLGIGKMEIWDGADLSLIRDALLHLVEKQKQKSVGVDMRHVKYVPSGFFGMISEWCEQGVEVWLFDPQERVKSMLWFKTFLSEEQNDRYLLHSCAHAEIPIPDDEEWADVDDWDDEELDQEVALGSTHSRE